MAGDLAVSDLAGGVDSVPVLVTTAHRGVFFGYAPASQLQRDSDVIDLERARMAIYWGTTKGVMQLCETGPTEKSRISSRANVHLRAVTAVFSVTPEAVAKWEAAS